MSDSLTCHYYHRCTCISYLMIPMLMSFEFNLIWWVWDFFFPSITAHWGRGGIPPPLPQPTICKCSRNPAVAPNSLFPATSVHSCASLDMLCCALWHNCLVILLLSLYYRCCGEIQNQTQWREHLFREHSSFGLFLWALGIPMLQICWIIAVVHLGVNVGQLVSFSSSLYNEIFS